ncbi:class I SAM-dependent methyltransferase [Candidatus Peregrinibacteria bacterium]|nr:class I SAM-dependent methyltransferase [Candidatus Peregrinibacteria bacterium]
MNLALFRQTDSSDIPLRGTDVGNLLEAVHRRYNVRSNDQGTSRYIVGQLIKFGEAIGAIDPRTYAIQYARFRALKVLDLACGCEGYMKEAERNGRNTGGASANFFGPWLCRTLSMLEANVTGVDREFPRSIVKTEKKGRNPKRVGMPESEWIFVQRDLTQLDAIDQEHFPDNSFDAVSCTRFIGNKSGPVEVHGTILDPVSILGSAAPLADTWEMRELWEEDNEAYCRTLKGIREAAQRILREGGVFMLNTDVEIKTNGALKTRMP